MKISEWNCQIDTKKELETVAFVCVPWVLCGLCSVDCLALKILKL